jgi:hypothetical protein
MSIATTFSALFQLLRLPAGRVGWALTQLAPLAEAAGDAPLAARARRVGALAAEQSELEARWRLQRDGRSGAVDPELSRLDLEIDAGLHDLQDLLQIFARSGLPARAEPARRLLAGAFRGPLAEHTQLPWSEQVGENDRLLERLGAPELADDLRKLDLGPTVDRLRALQDQFRTRLPARSAVRLSWEDVLAGRSALHVEYLGVVAELVGRHGRPGDTTDFERLMAPVLAQEAELRAWRRGRRTTAAPDVEPGTGAPAGAEATEADGDRRD